MCFNPSTGLSVFQTDAGAVAGAARKSFNPSTGLSVFQTLRILRQHGSIERFNPSTGLSVFQTCICDAPLSAGLSFQSLDWVERLSDADSIAGSGWLYMFQSLDWVERLSDDASPMKTPHFVEGFNPSTGLSVFQTNDLGWQVVVANRSFNPSTGLSVFQTP